MSYPDYAMSQGGDDDGDFGYLEFEAGTQNSQYDYADYSIPSQQTQNNNNNTQDDLNFMNLSLNGPQSQSELNDDLLHHNHFQHPSGNTNQQQFDENEDQDANDQPLALTELPPHACKYVSCFFFFFSFLLFYLLWFEMIPIASFFPLFLDTVAFTLLHLSSSVRPAKSGSATLEETLLDPTSSIIWSVPNTRK